ncbi:THAP domain-containing protein 1-like [Rhipicephalus sanguineus]|uniref:THAP domain-containing protein 1-like n=1 Tax=Rhipicephalus sanguineus TaxID=34632 RepID=UPI001895DCA2|nr:THAP domain-containing protein 1-like [Rhipicephalus sanguineus]
MPSTCAAYGCTSRGVPGSNIHFFRFPSVKRDRQRREAWIRAVKRQNEDGSPWQPSDSARLCEKHFVQGSPSNSPRHPDFVPSLFVYTDEFRKKDALQRYSRTAARTTQRDKQRRAVPVMPVKQKQDPGAVDTSSGGEENSVEMEESDNSYSETTEGTMDAENVDTSNASRGHTLQENQSAAALLMLDTTAIAKDQVEDDQTTKLNSLMLENIALCKKIQDLEAKCTIPS